MKKSILLLPILLCSCASMIRGEQEPVSFNTTPSGALIALSNGMSCTSPCSLNLTRGEGQAVTASKKGCHDKTAALSPKVEAGTFMYSGVFDYMGNGAYTLTPNPVYITLDCK